MFNYRTRNLGKRLRAVGAICVTAAGLSSGQVVEPAEAPDAPKSGVVVAPRPGENQESEKPSFWDRVWISGQVNSITQYHPGFHAPYSGYSSAHRTPEMANSDLMTLYTGIRLTNSTEVLYDLEVARNSGISNVLGLAGFTNADIVRDPTLGLKPYSPRFLFRQIIGLSKDTADATPGPFGFARKLPVRRLEFRIGRLNTSDFFDINSVGSDPHQQFMNWTVVNNGAYEFMAQTYGAMLEYYDRHWALRFMEAMMPIEANGGDLDWSLKRSRSENVEWELQRGFIPGKDGVIRVLGFLNHANMGSYRDSVDDFLQGRARVPDITSCERQGTAKYGVGLNVEQQVTKPVRVFARLGWNDGRYESYAYSEVNRTIATGAQWSGSTWKRPNDQIGVAEVVNGLSGDHSRYLGLGGQGFLLGDGQLNYGQERVTEAYYTWNFGRGISAAIDLQHIVNPGYNRDRGPILVPSIRLHIDLDRETFKRKK